MAERSGEPSLSEVLAALAQAETVDEAAGQIGLSPERLRVYLKESAKALDWSGKSRGRTLNIPPVQSPEVEKRPPSDEAPRAPPTAAIAEGEPEAGPGLHRILEIFSDGAARGNPGPAGAGAVVRSTDGRVVARVGKYLGEQTNNVAEYEGLLLGLQKALDLGAREVRVFADSLLVVSQLRGEWKIKHPGLKPLYERARTLLSKFERTAIRHVPREHNTQADEMSNRAIDERM